MAQPKVFVSHSHHDNAFCRPFVAHLRAALGLDEPEAVFFDESSLHVGDAWLERIQHEVMARPIFLLILSPRSVVADYVRTETNLALRETIQRKHERLFISVMIETCDPNTLAPLLGSYQIADFVNRRYDVAFAELVATLRTAHTGQAEAQQPLPQSPPAHETTASNNVPALIPPERFPLRLAALGFEARKSGETEYILPPLCTVAAGEFLMGSDPEKDTVAQVNEKPQQRVVLPAFSIARFPVTVAEYACAVRAKAINAPANSAIAWQTQLDQRLEHPVVNVPWVDAVAYSAWLAQLTGQLWRLPTEGEWEKSARGTDGHIYPWGDSWEDSRANTHASGPGTTSVVGMYPSGASPCGAQDMAGNVAEWTSSRIRAYGAIVASTTYGAGRVIRGGSYADNPSRARAAARLDVGVDRNTSSGVYPCFQHIGFRLVRASPG